MNCHGGETRKSSFAGRRFWFLLRESVVCEPKESCLRTDNLAKILDAEIPV